MNVNHTIPFAGNARLLICLESAPVSHYIARELTILQSSTTTSMTRFLLPFFLAMIVLSCGTTTTTFTDTWKDPDTKTLSFKKIVALVITNEDIIQRSAETRMVENITTGQAVAAHSFLTREDLKNIEGAKEKMKQQGIDGAIVLRIISVDEQEQYVSGRYVTDPSYSFWGYYGYYWPRVYEPGYSVSQQIVTIESRIFSVTNEKLLWSGISRTPQPESVKALVDDLASATVSQLKKEGLLE